MCEPGLGQNVFSIASKKFFLSGAMTPLSCIGSCFALTFSPSRELSTKSFFESVPERLPGLRKTRHLSLVFISTSCPFRLVRRQEHGPSLRRPFISLPSSRPKHARLTLDMSRRHHRRRPRELKRTRTRPFSFRQRGSAPDFQRWVRRAELLWEEASVSERFTFGLTAFGLIAAAGVAINVLFHVSLAIAFTIIPLIFAPVLVSILASVSLFFMLTFASLGAGIFFVGTPLMAMAFLAKMALPFAIVAGGAAFVARHLLRWDTSDDARDEEVVLETPTAEDDLKAFDRRLRNRDGVAQKNTDVSTWDLSDVVDELDFTGLGEYRQLFIEERIDGKTLLRLTDDDIKSEFSGTMPLGDRMRLSQLVADLRRRASRLP